MKLHPPFEKHVIRVIRPISWNENILFRRQLHLPIESVCNHNPFQIGKPFKSCVNWHRLTQSNTFSPTHICIWFIHAQLLSNLHTPNEKKNRKQTEYAYKHLRYVLCRWPIKTKWNWLRQRRLRQHPLMLTKWLGPGPQPGPLRWGAVNSNAKLNKLSVAQASSASSPSQRITLHGIT